MRAILLLALAPGALFAQHDHSATLSAADMKAMAARMEMTPLRAANPADSARAARLVSELRTAISKYRDVRVAVQDGFRQFAPQMKNQRVYHFTNYRWGFENSYWGDDHQMTGDEMMEHNH